MWKSFCSSSKISIYCEKSISERERKESRTSDLFSSDQIISQIGGRVVVFYCSGPCRDGEVQGRLLTSKIIKRTRAIIL